MLSQRLAEHTGVNYIECVVNNAQRPNLLRFRINTAYAKLRGRYQAGEPFVLRSGSVHYSRVPRAYWRDRLLRVRALGLNAVTTYVPWNLHETEPNAFDFAGAKHVGAFLDEAKDAGLLAILRVGPYMCGEWDLGGFPAWLLAKENVTLRTWNAPYIAAVDSYWDALLPRLRRHVYSNGGPVAMIQLENEFGDYGDCSANKDDAK